MIEKFWDFFVTSLQSFFIPLVCSYFALTANVFLNTACEEAGGLEKVGNTLLIPLHYLTSGQIAVRQEAGWIFEDQFAIKDRSMLKTTLCATLAAPSLVTGLSLKALSFFSANTRKRHQSMEMALAATHIHSNARLYQTLGLPLGQGSLPTWEKPLGLQRRPGDETNLAAEKEALKEVGALLDELQIPWWIDCGTCLGAYRYGGVIPWDEDVDVAILLPDFENARRAFNRLDPNKYIVQDWSARPYSKSFMKIFIRKTGKLIDIYNYRIIPEQQQIQYILSFEESHFFPEWVKVRERRFTEPVSYHVVFPLKRMDFDGIAVNVPHNIKKYLQRYYGENLDPAKVYDPQTNQYEKDLTHPYWQRQFAH